MLIVKVKICGITNYGDAAVALDMGADLLGFNFYAKSPRFVPPDKAKQIINMLPGFVDIAGVFVNESIEKINETKNLCQLDWIQLHGDETPEFCKQFLSHNVKVMKAIRVKDQSDIQQAEDYFTDAVLLDAFDPEKYGGTGLSFDWNIIGHIGKRVFLELGVYGIDICSGIEAEPGKKDHDKVKKLFENIRHLRG
jgi:phosphoribosylanthranilate isomerase